MSSLPPGPGAPGAGAWPGLGRAWAGENFAPAKSLRPKPGGVKYRGKTKKFARCAREQPAAPTKIFDK